MSRVWFAEELETVATFWRVLRRDGVALGFTTHDGDLWFNGILHRAAPGMVPSAIRRSAGFDADSAEVEGALAHDSIDAKDLAAGRFDGAVVMIGLVDWQNPAEHFVLYRGTIGTVSEEGGSYAAALASRKAELQRDPIPRTSPTCRAEFCGPGCNLSGARFDQPATVTDADPDSNTITLDGAVDPDLLVGGELRWIDGPLAGSRSAILGTNGIRLVLSAPLDGAAAQGRVILREGCDRTITTCATRFGNAINFRGEPYLPGNDMIARYPAAS
jgi:uncharacterized phage protein (TIGR02218 family)